MLTRMLKAKLHHAVVTRTNPEYHGSITIDRDLLRASGLLPYEAVLIADCENGNRFETYILPGEAGSGAMEINGAAARLTATGHRIIVMAFSLCDAEDLQKHQARVLLMNPDNTVKETHYPRAMEG